MFSSGCRRGILALGSGGGFNPLTLFAAGEQGGWWDPSDLTTMFQDSAGTTPVTAANQPVGLIRDKSGKGNHRTQATAASRPTLQVDSTGFYLLYDGVDDFMATAAAVDFSAVNKVTVFAGVYKASDTSAGIVVELTTDYNVNNGAFGILAPNGNGNASYAFFSRGTTLVGMGTSLTYAAPIGNVITGIGDISTPTCAIRASGTAFTLAGSQGTGNYANASIYFGRRAGTSLPFSGRDYGSIILGRAATVGEIAQAERYIGSRMGIAL